MDRLTSFFPSDPAKDDHWYELLRSVPNTRVPVYRAKLLCERGLLHACRAAVNNGDESWLDANLTDPHPFVLADIAQTSSRVFSAARAAFAAASAALALERQQWPKAATRLSAAAPDWLSSRDASKARLPSFDVLTEALSEHKGAPGLADRCAAALQIDHPTPGPGADAELKALCDLIASMAGENVCFRTRRAVPLVLTDKTGQDAYRGWFVVSAREGSSAFAAEPHVMLACETDPLWSSALAKAWAAANTLVDLDASDIRWSLTADREGSRPYLSELTGPSAGAAMALALTTLGNHKHLSPRTTASAAITDDGAFEKLGSPGHLPAKIRAAVGGYAPLNTLILAPKDYEELRDHPQDVRIRLVGQRNLSEALRIAAPRLPRRTALISAVAACICLAVGVRVLAPSSVPTSGQAAGSEVPAGGVPVQGKTATPSGQGEASNDPVGLGAGAETPEELINRGDSALRLQNEDDALDAYELAIKAEPDSPRAHAGRSVVLLKKEREREALREIDLAISFDFESATAGFFRQRARVLVALKRLDDALLADQESLKRSPTDPASLAHIAYVLNSLSRADEALTNANAAIQNDPLAGSARTERGDALRRLGDLPGATAALDEAIRPGNDRERPHIVKAAVLIDGQQYEDALIENAIALDINPSAAGAHRQRGWILWHLEEFARAIEEQRLSLRYDDEVPTTYYYLGLALHYRALESPKKSQTRQDGLEAALEAFEEAEQRGSDGADVPLSRGVTLYELERWKAAITSFEEAALRSPTWALPEKDIGDVYYTALKKYRRALEYYDRAIADLEPYAEAHHRRANTLWQLGRFDEALDGYRRAAELAPEYFDYQRDYAGALIDRERFADALPVLDRTLFIEPESVEALYLRGFWSRDSIADYEGALSDLNRALEFQPKYAPAYYGRGWIYHHRFGDPARGIPDYDAAIKYERKWAQPHAERGNALDDLGRRKEAARSYERALELEPTNYTAILGKIELLAATGRFEELSKFTDGVLKKRHTDASRVGVLQTAGDALFSSNPEQAGRYFERASRLDTTPYSYQRLGDAYLSRNLQRDAIEAYQAAIARDPGQPGARWDLAYALYLSGDLSGALASVAESLVILPSDPDLISLQAWLYGRASEAASA